MDLSLRGFISSFNEKAERYISLLKNSENCTAMGCTIEEIVTIFKFLSNLISYSSTLEKNTDVSNDLKECLDYILSLQGNGDEVKRGFILSKSTLDMVTALSDAKSSTNGIINGVNEMLKASDTFVNGLKGLFGSFSG